MGIECSSGGRGFAIEGCDFNGESLASVGISSRRAVFWFMRKIFEPESKSTFIVCFCPLISINAFPSGQA